MELVKIAKTNLRSELKNNLAKMSSYEKVEQSKVITKKLLNHPIYKVSSRVSVYLSMDSEVQTNDIVKNIFDSAKICFVPKYDKHNMTMEKVTSMKDLESLPKTKWNIQQPADNDVRENALITGGLDLMIVPGLGFTACGKRLGRGKGYYDKCLAEYRSTYPNRTLKTVGLAFIQQMCEDIPTSNQDFLLDVVLSP